VNVVSNEISVYKVRDLCDNNIILMFMFVPCINSIKTLFYYSKLMHTIIKS